MLDIEKQKGFQTICKEKNELIAYEHFLEEDFGKRDVETITGLIKDADDLKKKDMLLLQAAEKKYAEYKATGNLPYKERKELEAEIAQHEDNIKGLTELIDTKYIPLRKRRQEQVDNHGVLAKRHIDLAVLATTFIVKEKPLEEKKAPEAAK